MSQQPGDNYRVAVSCDSDYISQLQNVDQFDKLKIKNNETNRKVHKSERYCSHVLTVWRILHVESDAMRNHQYHVLNGHQNIGVLIDFTSSNNKSNQISRLHSSNQINIYSDGGNNNLLDYSNHTGSPTVGDGRFQNGKVLMGLVNTPGNNFNTTPSTITGDVLKNGYTEIELKSNISLEGLKAVISAQPGTNVDDIICTVDLVEKSAGSYLWTFNDFVLPANIGINDYVNGSIMIGDYSPSTMPINAINQVNNDYQITTNTLIIYYLLRDDDFGPQNTHLGQETNLSGLDTYKDAYLIWANDGGGKPIHNNLFLNHYSNMLTANLEYTQPYKDNADDRGDFQLADFRTSHQSLQNENPSFWGIRIISGFQSSLHADKDSDQFAVFGKLLPEFVYDSANIVTRVDDTELAIGGESVMIFHETCRDEIATGAGNLNYTLEKLIHLVVAHEVGHQFGLSHGNERDHDTNTPLIQGIPEFQTNLMGLMAPAAFNNGSTLKLIPRHINLIRSRITSPGSL